MRRDERLVGYDDGRVVVRNAVVGDREDVDLKALALRLDDFPTLIDPGEVELLAVERFNRVEAGGDVPERGVADAATAQHLINDGLLVRGAEAGITPAIKAG